MADFVKFGGAPYHPSAANSGNEQTTVLRGKNMILRGSDGSYYFECYSGQLNLNEPLPVTDIVGTISYHTGSHEIEGHGTTFKTSFRFGQKFIAGNPTQVFVVENIIDDTHMTVQRPPDMNGKVLTAYKVPHLFDIDNHRGSLVWGNAIKFDRGNIIAVGEGRLRIDGVELPGESLDVTRRLQLAIFDPATLDYSVDEMGFATVPPAPIPIAVVSGGVKDMTRGRYSFRYSWADSRTGYGFSNPSEVIKFDSSNNPIEITSTMQRFKLDFTVALRSKPITADSVIVYRSLFSDPAQNETQAGEGSWFVAATKKIEELASGDVLYIDVLDGELATEITFDNDTPPEADWVSVLAGDPILISCYGDTVVGGGDRGTAPGPYVSPSRRGNRHGFPATYSTQLSPPETIIGFYPALGRLFLMTRVGLPFAASTGQVDFPVETRAFWTTRFKSPYGIVFFNDTFYAFTITGATRATGTADKAAEQINFSDAVADITREWYAGYVHAAYDPQNEMIVFIYAAAYRNDNGWWVSLALPYSLLHQCWMPPIEISKPDRDMIVTGAATIGSHLEFLAGGRGEIPPSPLDTANIYCSGNSLTAGHPDFFPWDYPSRLGTIMADAGIKNSTVTNIGHNSLGTNELRGLAWTEMYPFYDPKRRNIAILYEVGNDIYFNGNVDTAIADFTLWRQEVLDHGFQPLIVNLAHRGNPGFGLTPFGDTDAQFQAKLADARGRLTAFAAANAAPIVELMDDPRLSNCEDTRYYWDRMHHTHAGYLAIAQNVYNALIEMPI